MKTTRSTIKDYLDVHVTSQNTVIDAFSQYPMLEGTKNYTVELTEFCCPLTMSRLPPLDFFEDKDGVTRNSFFEVRRKHDGGAVLHDNTSMSTLANNLFPDDQYYIFRKSQLRSIETVSELQYQLQRFFNDFIGRYRDIDPASEIEATEHGYGAAHDDFEVDDDTQVCEVMINPSGTMSLYFTPAFTQHFFILVTAYGQKILGLPDIICFREDNAGNLLSGEAALKDAFGNVSNGGTAATVEIANTHSLYRYFDHRVRLEVETQMGIPITSVWSTTNSQQLSHVIATFPIQAKYSTTVVCDLTGTALVNEVHITDELQHGPIIFRRAEDKVSERYQILNSQYFHNIRLEVFVVRREFGLDQHGGTSFKFKREKMTFDEDDYWTAKLRFRSLN
jgi:hypothetical protein